MPVYRVEVEGLVREIYEIEADSEAEALADWNEGNILNSEAWDCEPVAVKKVED